MTSDGEALHHPKAPIVEALIDLRFSNPLTLKELEAPAKAISKSYASMEQESQIQYTFEVGQEKPKMSKLMSGYRMSSADRAQICILRQNSLTVSQLSPYDRWEVFCPRAKKDWGAFTKSVSRREISRLAVRYINRIDIPSEDEVVKAEDYLRVYAYLPPDIGDNYRIDHYVMQLQRAVGEDCKLIINTASAISPLPNHVSFLLDLEVYIDVTSTISEMKVWTKFDEMRRHKNHIFENLITDKARALFK